MSTIQQSKVKTLSDQAHGRSAQWADQAFRGRPAGFTGHADIDSVPRKTSNAAAGVRSTLTAAGSARGTDSLLFDDLQVAGSTKRDNPPNGNLLPLGSHEKRTRSTSKSKGRKEAQVMTAELPFATSASQDDAGELKLRRRPAAGPYRGMQLARRSSLPTLSPRNSPKLSRPESTTVKEWQDSLQDSLAAQTVAGSMAPPSSPAGPFQNIPENLSQLLAKPEVGGYLVMGILIACTFLV